MASQWHFTNREQPQHFLSFATQQEGQSSKFSPSTFQPVPTPQVQIYVWFLALIINNYWKAAIDLLVDMVIEHDYGSVTLMMRLLWSIFYFRLPYSFMHFNLTSISEGTCFGYQQIATNSKHPSVLKWDLGSLCEPEALWMCINLLVTQNWPLCWSLPRKVTFFFFFQIPD